ncbi:MAG: hypothetical protein P8Y69_18510, partial [Gammaproteobacteria bacterium]
MSRNSKLSRAARLLLDGKGLTDDWSADTIRECDAYIRKHAQEDLGEALKLARYFAQQTRRLPGTLYSVALRTLGWVMLLNASFTDARKAYLKARKLVRSDSSARA